MMGFREFLAERNLARAGAVTVFAAKSKQYGDKSQQDFKNAKQILTPVPDKVPVEQRLARMERVLDRLLSGLINQRKQIGNHVSISTSGHLLASSLLKKNNRRR